MQKNETWYKVERWGCGPPLRTGAMYSGLEPQKACCWHPQSSHARSPTTASATHVPGPPTSGLCIARVHVHTRN